jgi:hypothetical protein
MRFDPNAATKRRWSELGLGLELAAFRRRMGVCNRALTTRDCSFSHDWRDGLPFGGPDHPKGA